MRGESDFIAALEQSVEQTVVNLQFGFECKQFLQFIHNRYVRVDA